MTSRWLLIRVWKQGCEANQHQLFIVQTRQANRVLYVSTAVCYSGQVASLMVEVLGAIAVQVLKGRLLQARIGASMLCPATASHLAAARGGEARDHFIPFAYVIVRGRALSLR